MICDDCTKGSLLPGEPTGFVTDLDGAYLAPGTTETTQRAIFLLTDAFGLPLVNSKLIADNLSKRLSCDVWVPDLFNGEPLLDLRTLEPGLLAVRAGVKVTIWNYLRLAWKLLPRIGILFRSRASVVDERAMSFIKRVREQKKYDNVGAVGYCFGGALAVRLGSANILDSIVVCHPGHINKEQIRAINIPTSWACAEEDMTFSQALRERSEAIFAARKDTSDFIEYEFSDYKGTAHGFAIRPNFNYPDVKEGYEKAFEQTVSWFERTLT